jgi:acylphosphatase
VRHGDPPDEPALRRHILIDGRVQGVGFRYALRARALAADLAGWARNLPDGRVEAELEGAPTAVDSVIEWARSGPSFATVTRIEVTDARPAGERGFRITG